VSVYNKGVHANATDRQIAYKLISSSVDIDPTFTPGWFQVGNFNSDLGLLAASAACYRRALEIDPTDAKIWTNLGHRLYHMGEFEEAEEVTRRALDLDPNLAFAVCNLSLIQSIKGEGANAIRNARKAFELDQSPIIETALAFALLFEGKYAEGLKHFEARFPYRLQSFTQYPYPPWRGEDVSDKTVLIQADQGLGDTLCYVRFVPAVAARAGRVIMLIQPELCRLFRAMLQAHPNVEIQPLPAPFPAADYWTSTVSVPVALGLTDDEIRTAPNLPMPPFDTIPVWKAPDRKLHIAICWAGSSQNEIDRHRSMRVEQFLDLYQVPGIQIYSLQIGERAMELHAAGCAALIKDLAPHVRDVADTVAILREMDLVICVETSLGHIAGAIEKECWIMLAKSGGDYRCGRTGDRQLWNPNTTLFRQGDDGTWGPVIERVIAALGHRVHDTADF
jgi:hypothetical protein